MQSWTSHNRNRTQSHWQRLILDGPHWKRPQVALPRCCNDQLIVAIAQQPPHLGQVQLVKRQLKRSWSSMPCIRLRVSAPAEKPAIALSAAVVAALFRKPCTENCLDAWRCQQKGSDVGNIKRD